MTPHTHHPMTGQATAQRMTDEPLMDESLPHEPLPHAPLDQPLMEPSPISGHPAGDGPAAADITAPPGATPASALSPAGADPGWDGPSGWQMLPIRARRVFLYVALMVAIPPTLAVSALLYGLTSRYSWALPTLGGLWVVVIAFALWVGYKRYHYTFWKLDADGFAVRRGRLWQWETRVPTSRVQHLDIKRGPLERWHRLASLVLHTAGTRLSAVSISGLDDADAERLRDHFSRQIDRQEDDDHADA